MSTCPALFLWLLMTLPTLAALGLLYAGILRAEPCLRYNRAVLLLAPPLAALLPLLPRPDGVAAWLPAALGMGVGAALPAGAVGLPQATAIGTVGPVQEIAWAGWPWLLGAYGLGVALLLGRLAWRVVRLRKLARRLPTEIRPGYRLALTGGRLPTSSFGRTVFWDETAELTAAEAAAVLAHELAHVRQGHSLDVLWLEAWRAVLWVNPFAHWLLPAARLTHELLADRAAQVALASATADSLSYPTLLARLAARPWLRAAPLPLLLPFTFSFTLARLAMLQNPKSVRRWKQWLVLPVLSGLVLACPALAQTTPDSAAARLARRAKIRQDLVRQIEQAQRQLRQLNAGHTPSPGSKTIVINPNQADRVAARDGQKNRVYTYVEQFPELPTHGGQVAIVQTIQQNLKLPAGTAFVPGRVFATFTVGADGAVRDSKIVKGLADAQDAAVLAAIDQLPRFVPGRQDGQPVTVSFTVPITFAPRTLRY